jgi:pyrroloquinoline quinone (PQQ) biosynthesis protein C
MTNLLAPTAPRTNVKHHLNETTHPQWVSQMLQDIAPQWERVVKAPVFMRAFEYRAVESTWIPLIKDFFCVVEAFPKYMGLMLARTDYTKPSHRMAREWLIGNIRVEANHVRWYLDWAAAHEISEDDLANHVPTAPAAALYHYLWSVAANGTLAEAIGAVNYAIEGTTGEWCRMLAPYTDSVYNKKSAMWINAHGKYDDDHPIEALELIKGLSEGASEAEANRITLAVERSVDYYARTLYSYTA